MKISIYGVLLSVSFLLNIVFVFYIFKNIKMKLYEKICLLVFESWGFVIGGKLFTYLTNLKEYKSFDFYSLSFSSLGAVIGGMLGLLIFAFVFKKSIRFIYERTLIILPLMYSVGKLGCFIVGCCYGIPYSGIGSVIYHNSTVAPLGVSLFPIQLIESITFLLLFIFILYRFKKGKYSLEILIILCGIFKFLLDFLRSSHNGFFSVNQIVCLIFIFGSLLSYKLLTHNKSEWVNKN